MTQFDIIKHPGTEREFVITTVTADNAQSALAIARARGIVIPANVAVVLCTLAYVLNDVWEINHAR